MKRAFVSIGLVALGASGGMSVLGADFTGLDSSKWWSASLSLRGFFDDNINTTSGSSKQHSYGFEISPSVGLHLSPGPQTDFQAGYTYVAHYTDLQPVGSSDHFDHTHELEFKLDHNFSERYTLSVYDSFVIGQEPDFLRSGNTLSTFQRVSGDNIRNSGGITFTAQITPLFGLEAAYANSFFDYDDSGATVPAPTLFISPVNGMPVFGIASVNPSLSGVNDRVEHTFHLDTHWQLAPKTVFVVGYQFRDTCYTGGEAIQATGLGGVYMSSIRNSRSHYGYVGVNQTFSPALAGSVKVGATYTDSYNDPADSSTVSPYAQLNVSYNYAPGSLAQVGFSHDRSANSRSAATGTGFVRDSETSTVFASVKQRITPKFYGTVMGTFQNSTISAPNTPQDGQSDRYFTANLELEYRFTQHLSSYVGYNFDTLDSDSSGSNFCRNRVYLGATLSY